MSRTLTNSYRRWIQAIEHGVHKMRNKHSLTSLLALATSTPGQGGSDRSDGMSSQLSMSMMGLAFLATIGYACQKRNHILIVM